MQKGEPFIKTDVLPTLAQTAKTWKTCWNVPVGSKSYTKKNGEEKSKKDFDEVETDFFLFVQAFRSTWQNSSNIMNKLNDIPKIAIIAKFNLKLMSLWT